MADSILDKVLLSKEDQEKQSFEPTEVINGLLKALTSKEADVLRRRFGFSEHGLETLETIGAHYHVTRERIRQIENQSIQKLRQSSSFHTIMHPVDHLVTTLLSHHGGVMSKEMMFETLLHVHSTSDMHQRAVTFLIDELMKDKVECIPKSKKYGIGWKLRLTSMDFVDEVVKLFRDILKREDKPLLFDQLYYHVQQTDFYRQNDQKLTEDAVLSYLDVSKELGRNPFDEYGLSSWGRIDPKRMNDRVYLVLQKKGKPMHFEDIAEEISRVFKKKSYPPTVHNELILNDEYVLVGRGIYALKEWGFKEGVVSDVIVEVMRHMARPMTRGEVVDAVLKQRIVKKNTIHLALTDKSLFKKTADGKYMLLAPSAAPPASLPMTGTLPQD